MAEQFGYRIVLDYKGTEGLTQFRKDAQETTKAVRALAKQAAELKGLAKEFRAISKETSASDSRAATEEAKKRLSLEKEKIAALKTSGQLQKNKDDAELRAVRKLNAQAAEKRRSDRDSERSADRQASIRRKQLALVAKQAREERKLAAQRKRAEQNSLRAQQRSLRASKATGNAFTAAISRTIRFFVVFRAFQEAIQLVSNSIRGSLDFAALLEESQKQMAGLILSAGALRDSMGTVVGTAEAFPLAMGLAADVMSQLRVDAVLTAATFQELVTAMQVSTAPGLAADLDLNQIRQVTVAFSQAATAFGLEQRDLAEEIRSTLQGTINPRNTRIATALGISPDDIRAAKEQGQLFEFLQERMQGVQTAAGALQSSLTVLRSNFQDVLQIAGAAGIQPVFEELKGLYEDLIDTFTQGDLSEGVRINPAVTSGIELASEGLAALVASVREFAKSETAGEIAESLAISFGELGKTFAEGLPELLEAFAAVLLTVVSLTKGLAKTLSLVNPELLAFLAVTATVLPIVKGMVGAVSGMVAAFLSLKAVVSGVGLVAGAGGLAAMGPAIAAVAVAATVAALIIGKNYSNAIDKAALKARAAAKISREYEKSQAALSSSFVSLSDNITLGADKLEKFAATAKKAADSARDVGRTEIQKEFFSRQREIESTLSEGLRTRTRLEQEYQKAVFESEVALARIPDGMREIVEAQQELATQRAFGADDALIGELTSNLEDAVKAYDPLLTSLDLTLEDLKNKRQEISDELLGLVRDQDSGQIINRSQPLGPRSPQAREQADVTDELKKTEQERSTRLKEILTRAVGYSDELIRANQLQAQLAGNIQSTVESQKESNKLMAEFSAFTNDTLFAERERNQVKLRGLRTELINERNNTNFQGSDELDFIRLAAQEEAKREPIVKRITELERTGALLRQSDLQVVQSTARAVDLSIKQEQSKLIVISKIFGLKRKQLEFTKKEEGDEAAKRISDATEELRIRQAESDLLRQATQQGASASIGEIQARGATQRAEAAARILDTEFRIAGLEVKHLQNETKRAVEARKLTEDKEKQAELDSRILELGDQLVDVEQRRRLIQAQRLADAQKEAERTQVGAGFNAGLQDAVDDRARGDVFRDLATNLVGTVESGLTEAIVQAFTGGDVDAAIDQMIASIQRQLLDAVVQAFIVGPIVDQFTNAPQDLVSGAGDAAATAALTASATTLGITAATLGVTSTALGVAATTLLVAGTSLGASGLILGVSGATLAVSGGVLAVAGGALLGAAAALTTAAFVSSVSPFAEGGLVGGSNMAHALPGHPSSDTALIAATPGEFIFTKSMTAALGVPFLEGLRNSHSSPTEMRHALQSRLGSFSTKVAAPYAGGGTVARQVQNPTTAPAARGGSTRTGRIVAALTVTPKAINDLNNNRTMDNILRVRKSGALRLNSEEWV